MTMRSLDRPAVRKALAALMIGGMTVFPGKYGNRLSAAELPVAHLNLPVSMQELLSRPEYAEDLKIHKKIADGTFADTLKRRGGLMTGTSTYVLEIGKERVACTMNKDSLFAYFGFKNFPDNWRAQQRDREASGIKGAQVPLELQGSSAYTEAAMYGHEGLIVLYTPHDKPNMGNSLFIFYPFTNPKKQWNYGTLVENGPKGKRFVSKTKWYDPYALQQGEGGITMLTQQGEGTFCHFLPQGYLISVVHPLQRQATSKTAVDMAGNIMTVSVAGKTVRKVTIYPVFKGETFGLTDYLNDMSPSDLLAPVISRMPLEAGSELERVLAIEQTAAGEPKVVLTDPFSPEKMIALFGAEKFGGREIYTIDLGVGSYVALDGAHGKAWEMITVDAVCLVYAGSKANEVMPLALHRGRLQISNPDAPLNQQKPVFAASSDGYITDWLESRGAFQIFYPSSGILIETEVKAGIKGASVGIDRSLNRMTLKGEEMGDVVVHVNEPAYKFVGDELKFFK